VIGFTIGLVVGLALAAIIWVVMTIEGLDV
jgi:hypothetical protein